MTCTKDAFEEEGETAVLPGPGRHDRLHAVLRTSASWESGDQLRRELHGVEVPPSPLVGVIGKPAGNATFRARDARTEVREPNLDSPLFEPKVHRVNPPRVIDPEQSSIMRRECFHPRTLRHRSLRNDRPVPRKSPKNRILIDSDLPEAGLEIVRPGVHEVQCGFA